MQSTGLYFWPSLPECLKKVVGNGKLVMQVWSEMGVSDTASAVASLASLFLINPLLHFVRIGVVRCGRSKFFDTIVNLLQIDVLIFLVIAVFALLISSPAQLVNLQVRHCRL